MVFFILKIFFRKRAAALVLSIIFLYTCYYIILSEKNASLIVAKINIGSKQVKTNQIYNNKVQDIKTNDSSSKKKKSFYFQSTKRSKKKNNNRYITIGYLFHYLI